MQALQLALRIAQGSKGMGGVSNWMSAHVLWEQRHVHRAEK
jgi:hypothetical protein